jgi:hypothetical protein
MSANFKKFASIRKKIVDVCEIVKDKFSGADYLESNFRKILARELRVLGFRTYEEIVVPYRNDRCAIPFGHGFVDIACWVPKFNGVIILELKTNMKSSRRQLVRYIRHWEHTKVLFGMSINFANDIVRINDVEPETKDLQFGSYVL